jgi:predicted nuclease of predicted toxin-antitoxin system
MRYLADENFPGDAVAQLKSAGHDVIWIREAAPGISDAEIVAWAERESRIILTFDKDFGELAWRAGLPSTSGIVLFRLPMAAAADIGADLAARLDERNDWAGHFTVIEPGRVRMRRLA